MLCCTGSLGGGTGTEGVGIILEWMQVDAVVVDEGLLVGNTLTVVCAAGAAAGTVVGNGVTGTGSVPADFITKTVVFVRCGAGAAGTGMVCFGKAAEAGLATGVLTVATGMLAGGTVGVEGAHNFAAGAATWVGDIAGAPALVALLLALLMIGCVLVIVVEVMAFKFAPSKVMLSVVEWPAAFVAGTKSLLLPGAAAIATNALFVVRMGPEISIVCLLFPQVPISAVLVPEGTVGAADLLLVASLGAGGLVKVLGTPIFAAVGDTTAGLQLIHTLGKADLVSALATPVCAAVFTTTGLLLAAVLDTGDLANVFGKPFFTAAVGVTTTGLMLLLAGEVSTTGLVLNAALGKGLLAVDVFGAP